MRRISSSVLLIACLAACGGLAHPLSNDGNDVGNALGANPGTHTLTFSVAQTDLGVGDTEAMSAMYDGAPVQSGLPVTSTNSNPSVIGSGGLGVEALSVGTATLTATYQGATASVTLSVHSQDGLNAVVFMRANPTTGPAWYPDSVTVQSASTVEFNLESGALFHNVVFDPIPGAPANIPEGTTNATAAEREFPTAGIFTYQCTIHGERGVVVVTP